ncbi:22253_t:CDS:2, partial [Entrophospora sp. SA101]
MENHEINDTTAENNDTTIVTTDFDGNNKRVFGNIRRNLLSDGDSAIERKSLKLFDQLLKTATWVRLENVLKNKKVKLQESSNEKYKKQTLKLAKIFKHQFKDCHNKFTEEKIEYKFFYAQTYTTYFFNRGEKMLKASAILKNELLQDNYRCSHGNKIGLVISIADIKIRKCDHGNHKFYAYSMCMLFSAIYYFKLEFKFEYPITMRTLSEIWTKFMENEEIMTYIDSEEGEENDGAISVDMVNQSPRK